MGRAVVLDAPLLYESGWLLTLLCRPVVVVAAPQAVQIERLIARDGVTAAEAAASVGAQMATADKVARADFVIHNEGSSADLEVQVDKVWRECLRW